LGERLLCKQEVVGSIPSGSTRRHRDLQKLVREIRYSGARGIYRVALVLSDIVKRRSIRAQCRP
jgi:hypothetical protein